MNTCEGFSRNITEGGCPRDVASGVGYIRCMEGRALWLHIEEEEGGRKDEDMDGGCVRNVLMTKECAVAGNTIAVCVGTTTPCVSNQMKPCYEKASERSWKT